jgi:hypothetical protein
MVIGRLGQVLSRTEFCARADTFVATRATMGAMIRVLCIPLASKHPGMPDMNPKNAKGRRVLKWLEAKI